MSKQRTAKDGKKPAPMRTLLRAVPHRNQVMQVAPRRDGGALVSVPIRRPKALVPPLSWILPFSPHRRVELDRLGTNVLDLCDGKHTVESIIETFAVSHKLSFREAQLSVTQFLTDLSQRGLVAIVGLDKDANES